MEDFNPKEPATAFKKYVNSLKEEVSLPNSTIDPSLTFDAFAQQLPENLSKMNKKVKQ